MVRKSSIIPTDISSSREYYGLNNSQDIYKGTSFKFSGEWVAGTHYFNDEYVIDFVTHEYQNEHGETVIGMWACNRNHLSSVSNEPSLNSRFWSFVMSGATGRPGQVYVPSVDNNGNLVFTISNEPENSVINISTIRGMDGLNGKDGTDGKDGIDGKDGVDGKDGRDGAAGKDGRDGKDGRNGVDGKDGKDGADGKDGKVYIPSINNGIMTFTLSDSGKPEYRVDVNSFKGEKGDSGKPIEVKVKNESGYKVLYYRDEGSTKWVRAGEVGGEPGQSPKLTVWYDDNKDIRDDQIKWGYDGTPVDEWTTLCYLDDLRGDSISNIEINDLGQLEVTTSYKRKTENGEMLYESSKYSTTNTVLPEFVSGSVNTISADDKASVILSKTGNPREWEMNFSIPRGRDSSIYVSRTVTLEPDEPAAVINEGTPSNAQLRFEIPKGEKGDENVHIGCEPPANTDMIWYNPCEQTLNGLTALDFLYQAYLDTPGKRVESDGEFKNVHLERELFEKAIGNISPINGFEVRVKPSFDALGTPTRDKLGFIYLIPSSTESNDMYEEWIVVDTGETEVGANSYKWERWGSSSVNLDNYYTKDQVNQYVVKQIQQMAVSLNGGEIDSSSWE